MEQELQYEGPEDTPLILPAMTIIGENGPVDTHWDSDVDMHEDLNEFALSMPYNVSHETFRWIMRTRMEFVLLKRWDETVEGELGGRKGFNYVLAMLIDRRERGVARRMGIMAIPVRELDSEIAGVKMETVFLE